LSVIKALLGLSSKTIYRAGKFRLDGSLGTGIAAGRKETLPEFLLRSAA
jgi:hypothetical protein